MRAFKSAPSRTLDYAIRSHSEVRGFTTLSRAPITKPRSSLHRTSHGTFQPVRTLIQDGKIPKPTSRTAPPFAFAFDIDGVLLHIAKPIPGATETLAYLQQHNIPFILLTNGGGKHERERVEDLSNRLGIQLSTDNFVQSHTPFQELVDRSWTQTKIEGHTQTQLQNGDGSSGLADKNILITGSNAEKSRLIAEAYGFRSVITPADILAAHPKIFPFEPLLKTHYAVTARPLSTPNPKIDAIFVFNDPRDWALDTQIIMDLLLSEGGVLGTYSAKNGRGHWQDDGQPDLYFSNHDLFWSATYALPRFGQGAFQAALAGIWRQITAGKAELRRTTIGKPYSRTYAYAEAVLARWRAGLLEKNSNKEESVGETQPLARVYMVGDNPESDIRGANEYVSPQGTEWASILVRTGVWDRSRDGEPKYRPGAVVDDVKGAVEWALEREGWR